MVAISEQEIHNYDRDGVTCIRNAFSQEGVEFLRKAVDIAIANPGPHAEEYTPPDQPGRYFGDLDLWRRHDAFRQFVFQSPAAAIAGRIMQSARINFFYDQLLVKEPGTRDRTPWHQDQPYWAVSGRQVCSIWLPLDFVSRDVCVEFVAGSHRWDKAFNPTHFKDGHPYKGTGLPQLPDLDAERAKHCVLSWDL